MYKSNYFHFLLTSLLVMFLGLSISSGYTYAQAVDLEKQAEIIKELKKIIKKNFLDYRMLSLSDLDVDILSMHEGSFGKGSLPWVCFGYFNFDTHQDVAAIIINKYSQSRKLIVLHGQEEADVGDIFDKKRRSYSFKVFDDIYIGADYTLAMGSESSVLTLNDTISNESTKDFYYVYPLYDYITIIKWNSSKSILFLKNKTYRRVWISS